MKFSRLETLILGAIASIMCLTLVVVGGFTYFAVRPPPLTPTAAIVQNLATPATVISLPQNTATLAESSTPQPPTETATPALPTNTPQPTSTPRPTKTTSPSETPVPPTATPEPIGTLLVNSWRFEILEARSDPGKDSSRQNIVLLGNIYNEGRTTDMFNPLYEMVLRDSQGREYEYDLLATFAAEARYGAEAAVGMNPGSKKYVAYAYDVPASETDFTIVAGSFTASWSGNISFSVP